MIESELVRALKKCFGADVAVAYIKLADLIEEYVRSSLESFKVREIDWLEETVIRLEGK